MTLEDSVVIYVKDKGGIIKHQLTVNPNTEVAYILAKVATLWTKCTCQTELAKAWSGMTKASDLTPLQFILH